MSLPVKYCAPAIIVVMAVMHVVAADLVMQSARAQADPSLGFEGEYSGYVLAENDGEEIDVGLEVTSEGDNQYRATLYYGGLPEEDTSSVDESENIELSGTYEDYRLELSGDFPLRFQFIHGRFTALDEQNNYRGHLERVVRVQPVQ